MTVLTIRNVTLHRGQGEDAFALQIAGLALAEGQLLALHGPSGSGKSTCLELLAGVVRPQSAAAFVLHDGAGGRIDMAAPGLEMAALRAGPIGYGPQSGGLLGFLSARDNARSAIELSGRSGVAWIEDRFTALVRALGLSDCLGKGRGALSGGQRKRVSLLRALAIPRRLLVLDEPTAGLDDALADAVMSYVCELCTAEGTACIAAMHDAQRADAVGLNPVILRQTPDGAVLGDPLMQSA